LAKDVLAVYDPCLDYIERFLKYANNKENLGFEVWGYTDLNVLEGSLRNGRIIATLLSRDNNDERGMERIRMLLTNNKMNNSRIGIILGEQPDADFDEESENAGYIYKYQSAESILKQVSDIIIKNHPELKKSQRRRDFFVSGIYSPWNKVSHPREAASIAGIIRKNEKNSDIRIIYINLEQFSAMDTLLDCPKDAGMSDIIYYFRAGSDHLAGSLEKTVGKYMEMDVLTAPVNLEDLEEIEKGGWPDFLEAVSRAGDYHHIILDVSMWQKQIEEAILKNGNLYIPALPFAGTEGIEAEKLRKFREYLEKTRNNSELERVFELRLDADR